MIILSISDITTPVCQWISMNPSYILWPAFIGGIVLVMAIILAFKYKSSKKKLSEENKKISDQLKSNSTLLAELKGNKEKQDSKIYQYQIDAEYWRREFESKKSESTSLLSENRTLSQHIDTFKATIEEKTVQIAKLEESLSETRRQLEVSCQLLETERNEHQRILRENQAKIMHVDDLMSDVNVLKETLEAKEAEKSSLMDQLDTKESDITQLRSLLATKDSIIEEKDKTIKRLETRLQDAIKTPEQKKAQTYNEQNKHDRDERIHFNSEEHIYTINGCEFKSVTSVVDRCFEQFDAAYWAKKKAPSLGMTPRQVMDMWERKGEESRNLGSQMHEKIERYYLGLENTPDETYNLFCQFARQHHLKPYRTEWAIYDEDSKVAGTLDFLNYDDGVFTIYDWKRSNKIIVNGLPEKTSRWGKRAFSPIGHIHDTTFWHYALQVSIYRYILEKNYGIDVSAGRLAVFHPDYNRPYVVEVPYMRNEVMAVLRNNR